MSIKYTHTPSTESTTAYLNDVKTFFTDKWSWSKIEIIDKTVEGYTGDSTLKDSVEFYVDDKLYFFVMHDVESTTMSAGVGMLTSTGEHRSLGIMYTSSNITDFIVYKTSGGLWIKFINSSSSSASSGNGVLFTMKKLVDDSMITGFNFPESGAMTFHQGSIVSNDTCVAISNYFSMGTSSQSGISLIPPTDFDIPITSTDNDAYAATAVGGMTVYLAPSNIFPSDGSLVKFTLEGKNYLGNKYFVLLDEES